MEMILSEGMLSEPKSPHGCFLRLILGGVHYEGQCVTDNEGKNSGAEKTESRATDGEGKNSGGEKTEFQFLPPSWRC